MQDSNLNSREHFFDELDALAPARGASGDSGGVMDRVVSQVCRVYELFFLDPLGFSWIKLTDS